MGGGGSRPVVTVEEKPIPEDPYPTFAKGVEGVGQPAEGCSQCVLTIPPNISVSSVKISRPNETVTEEDCRRWGAGADGINGWVNGSTTLAAVRSKLVNKGFYTDPKDGQCKQLEVTKAGLREIDAILAGPALSRGDRGNLVVGKINPNIKEGKAFTMSEGPSDSGSFSSKTKVTVLPIIPLRYSFNGQEVIVKKMTLYHPCPLRVNNIQYDAVLSLNDPMDSDTTTVMLIPIKGESIADKRSRFFSNLVPSIASLLTPDPNTKKYESMDVPTGASWNLTTLLPTMGTPEGSVCTEPFYAWSAGTTNYEKYYSESQRRYKWKPIGASISYIMMENPVPMNSMDLQTLRRMPVTPPEEAIHPVSDKILYKAKECPKPKRKEPEPEPGQTKESFENEECDPFASFADRADERAITTETIFKTVLGILSALAVFIGVYFALKFAVSSKGDILKTIGDKIGKAIGGAGIKAMQNAVKTAQKVAEEEVKPKTQEDAAETEKPAIPPHKRTLSRPRPKSTLTAEEIRDIKEAKPKTQEDAAQERLDKSLTTEKPVQKPVQTTDKVTSKQLRDLKQFKA